MNKICGTIILCVTIFSAIFILMMVHIIERLGFMPNQSSIVGYHIIEVSPIAWFLVLISFIFGIIMFNKGNRD